MQNHLLESVPKGSKGLFNVVFYYHSKRFVAVERSATWKNTTCQNYFRVHFTSFPMPWDALGCFKDALRMLWENPEVHRASLSPLDLDQFQIIFMSPTKRYLTVP